MLHSYNTCSCTSSVSTVQFSCPLCCSTGRIEVGGPILIGGLLLKNPALSLKMAKPYTIIIINPLPTNKALILRIYFYIFSKKLLTCSISRFKYIIKSGNGRGNIFRVLGGGHLDRTDHEKEQSVHCASGLALDTVKARLSAANWKRNGAIIIR